MRNPWTWKVTSLTLTVVSSAGLAAQSSMPSAIEVREALETLRRLERAMAARPDWDLHEGLQAPEDPALRPDLNTALTAQTMGTAPSQQTVYPPDSFALSLDGDVQLAGSVFKGVTPLMHTGELPEHANTAFGLDALVSTTPNDPKFSSGKGNTAVGSRALKSNTSGSVNTAVGYIALASNTVGLANSAVGSLALVRNTTGSWNAAFGTAALAYNSSGVGNTATGFHALYANTTGSHNTASGLASMESNGLGNYNTATGSLSLKDNTFGSHNVADGYSALRSNKGGSRNTAIGSLALRINSDGSGNTAVGYRAEFHGTDGDNNTALGVKAGYNWIGHASNNIAIGAGANGETTDSGTVRIGGADLQTRTFIEGISATPVVGGAPVRITADDQLGVVVSSARFKKDIRDLESVSERLANLRPVSFRYRDSVAGQSAEQPVKYGLVAEEVAEVFPELVVNDNEGRPFAVRYDLLAPLLLGEIQQQDRELAALRRRLEELERER